MGTMKLPPRPAFMTIVLLLLGGPCGYSPPVSGAEPPSQPKKLLAIEDLYRFDAPQSLTLSPDGKRAAYIRAWIDPATKRERQSLWLVEGNREHARPLEKDEPDARSPVFSPDGKWIAFLSTRAR